MRTFALATLFAAVYADAASDAAAVKAAADKVIADAAAATTAADAADAAAAALVRSTQLTCDSYWFTTTVTNGWTCADESTCSKKDAADADMVDTVSKSAARVGSVEAVEAVAAVAADATTTPATPASAAVPAVAAVRGADNYYDASCPGDIVPGEVLGVFDETLCAEWNAAHLTPTAEQLASWEYLSVCGASSVTAFGVAIVAAIATMAF